MRESVKHHGILLLLVLAVARFALVFESGFRFSIGDFHATLPGPYAEAVNPTLWRSADLGNVLGRQPAYLRGPTQYVTMYPLVYFDSYATIAAFLLAAYGLVILLVAEVTFRMLRDVTGEPLARAPLFITTMCYFPLLQAWLGREFEVMIVAAFALVFWAAARNRLAGMGALLAYVTLYKYLPVIAVPYLIVRRWWRSLFFFAATSAVLIGTAHWLVGLRGFVSNHIPGMAVGLFTTLTSTKAFCDGPIPLLRFFEQGQDVGVRTALCRISQAVPLPPAAAYLALVALVLGTSLFGFWRLEHAASLPKRSEQWRRIWELSLVVIVSTTFFYGHYYYLGVLILPLNAIMVRLTRGPTRKWTPLGLAVLAYMLLSAFLVPPSFVSRITGTDVWRLYFLTVAYFPGQLIVLGLVLHQYVTLPVGSKGDRLNDGQPGHQPQQLATRYAAPA